MKTPNKLINITVTKNESKMGGFVIWGTFAEIFSYTFCSVGQRSSLMRITRAHKKRCKWITYLDTDSISTRSKWGV